MDDLYPGINSETFNILLNDDIDIRPLEERGLHANRTSHNVQLIDEAGMYRHTHTHEYFTSNLDTSIVIDDIVHTLEVINVNGTWYKGLFKLHDTFSKLLTELYGDVDSVSILWDNVPRGDCRRIFVQLIASETSLVYRDQYNNELIIDPHIIGRHNIISII